MDNLEEKLVYVHIKNYCQPIRVWYGFGPIYVGQSPVPYQDVIMFLDISVARIYLK